MPIDEVDLAAWTRKHDDPAMPVVPSAPRTLYPKSLQELIDFCRTRKPAENIHAAGSHWALSEAAISDFIFVETHAPDELHQVMGRTLYEVVPRCLNPQFVEALANRHVKDFNLPADNIPANEGFYPIHIETGKRVYQLYSELDIGDNDPKSLATVLSKPPYNNNEYLKASWAFQTLGGAGGQTVFGALTTGTHGGDFCYPPIADSVLALHLVADGGKHYWIEPESPTLVGTRLTDNGPLRHLYDPLGDFEILRNDDIFNSVLISAGRFGIVYSIVVAAVPQYCLHLERRLTTWQAIRDQINKPASTLYTQIPNPPPAAIPPPPPGARNRFLQIAISLTPHDNFAKNLAGVTKRWNAALVLKPGTTEPAGRPERRGSILPPPHPNPDPIIQAPRFEFAGNSSTYSPPDPSFLNGTGRNGDFMGGVIQSVVTEVNQFITSGGAIVGPAIAAVTAAGAGILLPALFAALAVILALLAPLLTAILAAAGTGTNRVGQVLNDLEHILLGRADPAERAAGLFIWQMIAFYTFSDQQKDSDFEAISYAVMDGFDYLDKNVNINVDSIEVFFDATDPRLTAFVDALLRYEIMQEVAPVSKAFAGYISMRFTGPTRALIGQQRFPVSCAVEVAGLRDVTGVTELIDYAIMLALDDNFKGILHWGQRNESLRVHVQERFGDTLANQAGDLHTWRDALSTITQHGKLDGFSNAFTRRTGLEIVTPIIGNLRASGSDQFHPITIDWDCGQNPSATEVSLQVVSPSGVQSSFVAQPLVGQRQVAATEIGAFSVSLVVAIDLGGERREAMQQANVTIT